MTTILDPVLFTEDTFLQDADTILATYGGKGANLRRMANELGFPVPQGFTIPTMWTFKPNDKDPDVIHPLLAGMIKKAVLRLNKAAERKLGDPKKPLLVSVRSGAPKSMPGMMETILNLGLNDVTVEGLAAETNERFAWDSYRRFIQMYAVTALDMDPAPFNEHFEAIKTFANTEKLSPDMLKLVVKQFREIVAKDGKEVPQDVTKQLHGAVLAVFRSWDAPKAKSYRKIENISDSLGTAVSVQRMVFGNMNDQSGTGVAFTRDPNTGENVLFGDFLVNAQGEDVVDGSHVTLPLAAMDGVFPEQYAKLTEYLETLETTFKDMCDVEFTIEDGTLYILQTRVGKRNPAAAIRIAVELLTNNYIDAETCIERLSALKMDGVKADASTASATLLGTGEGASPGLVSGKVVFTSDAAVAAAADGSDVILVTYETNPSDIEGMAASVGILTAKGGLVSHAAVVARGWGKACVVGCKELTFNGEEATINGTTITDKTVLVIDGTTGEVFVSA